MSALPLDDTPNGALSMLRYFVPALMIVLGLTPLWGCYNSTPATSANLEARLAKLERDVRTLETARDHAMARAERAERQLIAETNRLGELTLQRDLLQSQIRAKQTEQERLASQFTSLKQKLSDLVVEFNSIEPSNTDEATGKLVETTAKQTRSQMLAQPTRIQLPEMLRIPMIE